MAKVYSEIVDKTYLFWSKYRESSGTAGSFLKSYEEVNGIKTYYKMSNYNSQDGVIGYECVNEIIVDRLLNILGINHLSYDLIHAKVLVDGKEFVTWICASKDFKEKGDSKLSLESYYNNEKNDGESILDFCIRNNFDKAIYEMLAVDYLILNRDRHGANVEVLFNKSEKKIKIAPLFDHGLSLLFQCDNYQTAKDLDLLEDKKIQSFVGGSSAYNNLKLIPKDKMPRFNPLKSNDKVYIIKDLDKVIDQKLLEIIFNMIFERWKVYESIINN